MSLWEYANPVKFLKLSDKVLPFFVGFSIIGLSIGCLLYTSDAADE